MTRVAPIGTETLSDQKPARFTAVEIRDELAREINARKQVYGGLVNRGKLDGNEAQRRIAIMTMLWEDWRERAAIEQKEIQPDLLDQTAPPAPPAQEPGRVVIGEPQNDPPNESEKKSNDTAKPEERKPEPPSAV